jgi:FixJ family two-component response regulator
LPEAAVVSIVEDDAFVREATKGLVRSLGLTALTFESAEDFLQSGRIEDTSCVIADVQMPGLSGLELQSHLIAQGHRTPIIFITAFPEERLRTQALTTGAIGFLSKPFKEESLIDCIDTALKRRSNGHAGLS